MSLQSSQYSIYDHVPTENAHDVLPFPDSMQQFSVTFFDRGLLGEVDLLCLDVHSIYECLEMLHALDRDEVEEETAEPDWAKVGEIRNEYSSPRDVVDSGPIR